MDLFIQELNKYLNREVEVETTDGKFFKGKCAAIQYQYMNIVLEIKPNKEHPNGQKLAIKNVLNIRRDRNPEKIIKK